MVYNYICPYYRDEDRETQGQEVLSLLREAMKDERHDRVKYKMMMDKAQSEKVRRQIGFAYEDEGKHYTMFRQIYTMLTGKTTEVPLPGRVESYSKFIDAVETSIDGELEAVELYRRIRAMLPTRQMRDMLYEIITDEQEHATRFTYVYSILK